MVEKIDLPVVIPNKLLISPGIWNKNEYSAEELEEAFARTDWDDKKKISLWLNHEDRNTSAFIGYIKNPQLASQGRVFGDLEIWDEKTAILLTQAMAKFGISAKIKGEERKDGKMQNFSFENFSIVTEPACSDAYINLSKKEESEYQKTTSKYLTEFELAKGEIQDEPKEMAEISGMEGERKKSGMSLSGIKISEDFKSLSNNIERRYEKMEERLQDEEDKKKKKDEEDKEKQKPEEKENSKELSERDMLKELSVKFDKLIELLSKKKLEDEEEVSDEPEAEESAEEESELKENKELQLVKKELAEIKEKLNAPKSKTIRNLSSNSIGDEAKYDENVFSDFLGNVTQPVKFV